MIKNAFLHPPFIALLSLLLSLAACQTELAPPLQVPTITLDNPTATYRTKPGNTITIAPSYQHVQEALFVWKIEEQVIATTPWLLYQAKEIGDTYISLTVTNSAGEAYVEFKISVAALIPPRIQLNIPEMGYTLLVGDKFDFSPFIDNAEEATVVWYVNEREVAASKNLIFTSESAGLFSLKLTATNTDGTDELSFAVKVCTAEELPFSWSFEQTQYNLSVGRTIRLIAQDITNAQGADFSWEVDGIEQQRSKQPWFAFKGIAEGSHQVTVTMQNAHAQVSQRLTVHVCPPEGTYQRAATGNAQWNRVYAFMPAPGQFINEGYEISTMQEATTYAESRLKIDAYISLGGFGGYIVVGFDHSIQNDGDYNIQISGNSFAGSSEPGIVWVMQDENGDGLPNDTWYELNGSETEKGTTLQDYAVTYYKPKHPGMSVQWQDNQGKSGSIDYLGAFHRQEYYYPLWANSERITLRGRVLASNNRETSPGYWYNGEYPWGYTDNYSPVDRLTDDDNYNAGVNSNHLKISRAITFDGKPIHLKYIDFVKIVTGVNCKSGWLGEVSTEVFGINDFNLLKKTRTK